MPDEIVATAIDESPRKGELPVPYVRRIARAKLAAARSAGHDGRGFVLAADTVVACGRRILGQPLTRAEAAASLRLLSGRRHRVHTAICLAPPSPSAPASAPATATPTALRVVTTAVRFKRLSGDEIEAYLDCGEWRGKAGGYAIQGRAAAFVPAITGSYSNVVGLPLAETLALLEGQGFIARISAPAENEAVPP